MADAAEEKSEYLSYDEQGTLEKAGLMVSKAAVFILAGLAFAWLFAETGIFPVPKGAARVACLVGILLETFLLFMVRSYPASPVTRYAVVEISALLVLVLLCTLYFHVILVLILPVLLSVVYRDPRLTRLAMSCSLVVAFAAPVFYYLSGNWETDYFVTMLRFAGTQVTTQAATSGDPVRTVLYICLYLGLPNVLFLLAFSTALLAAVKSMAGSFGESGRILETSSRDELTGLMNSRSLDRYMELFPQVRQRGKYYCVYCCVHGLPAINEEFGYAAGNEAIHQIAGEIARAFGPRDSYRVSGDRFLSFAFSTSQSNVNSKTETIVANLKNMGCTISFGVAQGSESGELRQTMRAADRSLFANMTNYSSDNQYDALKQRDRKRHTVL